MRSEKSEVRKKTGDPGEQGTSTAVPRLRFPEFRDAVAWQKKPLSTLLAYERPDKYIVSDTAYQDSGTPVLTANKSFVLGYTSESKGIYSATPVVIFDDFTTDKKYVDFSFKVKSSAIKILKVKNDDSLRLIFELMCGIKFDPKEHKRYYISEYQNLEIAIPQQPEQQKIADCLTSLDEVIAAQGQKVEALKAHKRGLMQQLFPREGETVPRLRFPEFRDAPEWTLGRASDIVDVLQGYGFPERLQGNKEGEFPFYKVSDISACVDAGGIFLADANNHIDAGVLHELRAKLLPVGTTVFAKIGEAIRSNKRAITTQPCLIDNNAAGVKAIAGRANDGFVYHLWCQVPLIEYAGGVVPAVNKSAIEQISVCYPMPDEQQRIADCLSSLNTQIAAESNQLAALKTHKRGLMQQLFPVPAQASA